MKRLIIIIVAVFIATPAFTQSWTWDDNQEATFVGGEFGRLVDSDAVIKTMNVGGGEYEIRVYPKSASQSIYNVRVSYTGTSGELYEYKSSQKLLVDKVMTSKPLSDICEGTVGYLGVKYTDGSATFYLLGVELF